MENFIYIHVPSYLPAVKKVSEGEKYYLY